METTIQVKSAVLSANKEWYNIKDVNGKEYSVGLFDKKTTLPKNPKLKDAIEFAEAIPYSLTADLTDWNGKLFLNDVKPKTDKKTWGGGDKDNGLIVAQSCLKSICELYAGQVGSVDTIISEAEKAFNWCMSKSTKK